MKRVLEKFKIKLPLFIGGLAIVVLILILRTQLQKPMPVSAPDYDHKVSGPCPGDPVVLKMQDVYLRGILDKGQSFKLLPRYFDCQRPKVGELAALQTIPGTTPRVRIIRAVEGDKYQIVKGKPGQGWNIKINGKTLKISEQPYFFGAESPPTLKLYEKEREKSGLRKGEVLLFSAFPPGDGDSGVFGIYSTESLVGKVEPMGN